MTYKTRRQREDALDAKLENHGLCSGIFDCDCACAAAPDTTTLANASKESAQIMANLGQKQLDEAGRQYDSNMKVIAPIVKAQTDIMNQGATQGADYYQYLKDNQRPVETALKDQATAGTPQSVIDDRAAIAAKMGTLGANQIADAGTLGGAYDTGAAALKTGGIGIASNLQGNVYGTGKELQADAAKIGGAAVSDLNAAGATANSALTGVGATANSSLNSLGSTARTNLANVGATTADTLNNAGASANTALTGVGTGLTDKTAAVAGGVRDYLANQQNAIQGDVNLYKSGNQAIRDKYGKDIENDVGTAVADTRAGQTAAMQSVIRQGLRYGMTPNATAATAAGNASALSGVANATRQASTDKYRNLVGTGVGMEQSLFNTGAAGQAQAAGIEAQGAQAGAGITTQGQLAALDTSKTAALTNADLQKTGELTAADLGKTGALTAADLGKTGALTAADMAKSGVLASTALQGQAASQGAAANTSALTTAAGIQGAALSDSTNMGLTGTQKQIDMTQAGGNTQLAGLTADRAMTAQDSATSTAKLMDVAGLYRGLPGASTGAYSAATGAGNSAANNQMMPGNALIAGNASGAGIVGQGQQLQLTGLGSILNNQTSYANGVNQAMSGGSSALGGLGSALGGGAALYSAVSTKKAKTRNRTIDGEALLKKVESMPATDEWTYKPGQGDGGTHVGPYAEDMQKRFGNKVAPGGKSIDIISALGVNLAATKALAEKVTRLEHKKGA